MRSFTRALLLVAAAAALSGCTFSTDWIQQYRAERALGQHDYRTALAILNNIVQSNPDSGRALKAAREGARVAHFEGKNYPMAVEFYKHIVMTSTDPVERKSAQRYIAQIYFEDLADYDQAVVEYERLLKLDLNAAEKFRVRLNLAKSHLRLNNIDQALVELDSLLAQKLTSEEAFEARVFKANLFVTAKRLPEAARMWQSLMDDFPEKSRKENVGMSLVVCYEEMNQFNEAIEVLEKMRAGDPHPDFLDLRIQRLRARMGNQPGAQGGLKR